MKFYRFIGLILFFTLNIYAQNYNELAIKYRKGLISKILKNKEMVVGVQKNHLPYTTDNKNHPGIDIEIVQLLSKYLDVDYKLVYGNLDELLEWTSKKQVDFSLGGISMDINRSLAVNFSYPYLITTPAGVLNKEKLPRETLAEDFPKTKILNIGDIIHLPKLKIALKKNTIYHKLLQENSEFHRHEIILFKTNQEALDSVLKGENDLFISDLIFIKAYAIKNPDIKERFHLILKTYIEEYICAILPPDEIEFLLFFNTFIQEVQRKGKIKAIISKYLESRQWISE